MTVKKHLWIGLIEVGPLPDCNLLDGAKGAFVDVVTWAANAKEYKSTVELLLTDLSMFLVGIENSELVEERRDRVGGFDEVTEDIVARAKDNPNAIIYGTFHAFEKDNA